MDGTYTFVVNDYVPTASAYVALETPSPPAGAHTMIVTHRQQPGPVSPPNTLSPDSDSAPSASLYGLEDEAPAVAKGAEASDARLEPDQMQSVFSSQTGEAYRSQQHSPQVWETHKEEIRRLYLDENRPLKEVMAMMRQRGFRATVRMYKSRFDKWGFSKNNSKKEVATMLQVQRQRNALGKRTTFQRNGREVAIDAYLKRKGISQYDLAEPKLDEALPEHLRCVTPPPETPVLLQAGGALSLQELVLQCARDLAWAPYCPSDFPLVTSAAVYRGDALRCSITDLTNADWLFSVGHYERGGAMVEQGFRSLHLMLQKPSIYGLMHLLIFQLDAHTRGIAKEVWRYLAAYAATVRAEGPLARLFQGVFKFMSTHDYDEYWQFIFECTERLLLVDEQHTGLPADTVARLYPIIFIPRAHQYRAEPYRRLQSRCDWSRLARGTAPRVPEEMTVYRASELLILAQQSRRRQDPRVLELAEAVLEETKHFAYNVDFFVYIALTAMAHYYRADFDPKEVVVAPGGGGEASNNANAAAHATSIGYLERACALMEGRWDADMGYMMGDLELLAEWHREAGDDEAAADAHRRWRASLDAIPKKWERGTQGILR
ncbi:hypothetical protein GGR56DRAFT_123870 [Xylariaceae sp. FL0804]|nr:hypothetical protein GGR56DRAFT_123870 [Xylariaceae sp. FL0804]